MSPLWFIPIAAIWAALMAYIDSKFNSPSLMFFLFALSAIFGTAMSYLPIWN